MTEIIPATLIHSEETSLSDKIETSPNTKTRVITAAAIGAIGFAGALAENRGWVSGWPPPSHSLKHLPLGYYSAWRASKIKSLQSHQTTAILAAGALADGAAETGQDLVFRPDHSVNWIHLEANLHPRGGESDLDNVFDALVCAAGTAAFLIQQRRQRSRRRLEIVPDPTPEPTLDPSPSLAQSSANEVAA